MSKNLTIDDCVAMAIESYKTQRSLGFKPTSYCVVYAMTQYGFNDEDSLKAYDELLDDDFDFDDPDFFEHVKLFIEFECYLKASECAGIDFDFER